MNTEREKIEQESFTSPPFTVTGDTIDISLEKLNTELEPYQMKVDSIHDISINEEDSAINQGTVINIHCVDTAPGAEFNSDLFFSGLETLQHKFSALQDVHSCDIDKGELIISLVMNKQGMSLKKTMEQGGVVAPEQRKLIEEGVDREIAADLQKAMEKAGLEIPLYKGNKPKHKVQFDKKLQKMIPEVRVALIEKYIASLPKTAMVFYAGRKFDINDEGSLNKKYLADSIARVIYDRVIERAGQNPDVDYARQYAMSRSVMAMDVAKGMAMASKQNPYHITEGIFEEIINKVISTPN